MKPTPLPVDLSPHELGVVILVRAQPGARKSAVTGAHQGMLRVAVTQAPEKGKANKALVELLAKALGVKKSQVELLSGETSQQKKLLVRGITLESLAARIASLLAEE